MKLIFCFIGVFTCATAQLPGGVSPADPTDPYAMNLLWHYAVPKYNYESNYVSNSVPDISTLKLRKQVVAGINYMYDVHMVESNCTKAQTSWISVAQFPTTCLPRAGGRDEVCTFKIWDRAWLNDTQVTQMSCKPQNNATTGALNATANGSSPSSGPIVTDVNPTSGDTTTSVVTTSRPIAGAPFAADSSDPEVQSLLWNYIVKRYNAESNAITYSVPDLVSVKRQVVAGVLYTFVVQMHESSCTKYQLGLDLYVLSASGACAPVDGGRTDQCTVKIIEQVWLNRTEITNYQCNALISTDAPTILPVVASTNNAVNTNKWKL